MGRTLTGAVMAPLALVVTCAAQAGPVVWQRTTDWVPGVVQGGTLNNPGPAQGSSAGVWKYEWTQGGPLGSANPWYAQPRTTSKWDELWWQTGMGAWTADDDSSPPIMQDRIIHNLHTTTYDGVPVVSWINPMGDGVLVDVGGSLRLRWSGGGGLGFPVDVDVVVAVEDASAGIVTPLFSGTFSKPTGLPSINDELVIPIGVTGSVALDTDDRIIVSHRAREAFGPIGMWATVFDEVSITLVPSPGAMALLGLAGLLAGARRRR